jgi:hypothetical protein
MVANPEARVINLLETPSSSGASAAPYEGNTYTRNNQFLKISGWIGVSGDIDINNGAYRVLDKDGNVLMDWTDKMISNSTGNANTDRPAEVTDETKGSYASVKGQLGAHGITDFTVRTFTSNNLTVTSYLSTENPITIEYAVKIAGAPEGSDLVTIMVFTNVYKR